jgi:hypothetical protein
MHLERSFHGHSYPGDHTLMVMILDNESLITPERIRVYAFRKVFSWAFLPE